MVSEGESEMDDCPELDPALLAQVDARFLQMLDELRKAFENGGRCESSAD